MRIDLLQHEPTSSTKLGFSWLAPSLLSFVALFLFGCSPNANSSSDLASATAKPPAKEFESQSTANDIADSKVDSLIQVEDLILDLTPQLSSLAKWLSKDSEKRTEIPSGLERTKFLSRVANVELAERLEVGAGGYPEYVSFAELDLTTKQQDSRNPFDAVQRQVPGWRNVKFGISFGEFSKSDEGENLFLMHTKMSAKSGAGPIFGFSARQKLTWKVEGANWYLDRWNQEHFSVIRSELPLFEVATRSAIPDLDSYIETQRSYHDEILRTAMMTGRTEIYEPSYLPFMDPNSTHVLPSVSVVDLNDDGWDDLFISARWGRTQFLQNQKDGTFVDKTDEVGLRFPGVVNCSLFTDMDNDGDKDAIIGRALEPVVYLKNENGIFRDVTASLSDLGTQFMVSAISANDINRDGLVDFYLSTYAPVGDGRAESWESKFLSLAEQKIMRQKQGSDDEWLDYAGPPNVIVMNRGGGRLETVAVDETVSQWHNSYQTAWADFDLDGDDDLFVCNDFAPPSFLVNETPAGAAQPQFVDGTLSVVSKGMTSYSMGASWADFDQDGDLDLYVSNMYSKAGKRILKQLGTSDVRMKYSAAGNFLFENQGAQLTQRAGDGDSRLNVHQVGWSYGGQFGDFNNDGFSDLYVPSGYFTAPTAFATDVDL